VNSGTFESDINVSPHTKRLRQKYNQKNHKLYVVEEKFEEFDGSNFGLSKFEASLNLINKDGQRLSSFEISEFN